MYVIGIIYRYIYLHIGAQSADTDDECWNYYWKMYLTAKQFYVKNIEVISSKKTTQ